VVRASAICKPPLGSGETNARYESEAVEKSVLEAALRRRFCALDRWSGEVRFSELRQVSKIGRVTLLPQKPTLSQEAATM
jgi:hypothetical protein